MSFVYSCSFLSKLRNCLNEFAALMMFKHTILPFLVYAGFMLLACSVEDRRDLQICQTDALRICLRVKISDYARMDDLHKRCRIISLEQCRSLQLLILMFKKSKDVTMHNVYPRNTRRSQRIVFRKGHCTKEAPSLLVRSYGLI